MIEPGMNPDWKREPLPQGGWGTTLGGCLVLLTPLILIGHCAFGGAEKPKPAPTPSPITSPASPQASTNPAIERNAKAVMGDDIGPVNYNDLDDADRAIRTAINVSGNLCAKPILVIPTPVDTKYSVTCIINRSGKGRSRYLVDSQTGSVEPLR